MLEHRRKHELIGHGSFSVGIHAAGIRPAAIGTGFRDPGRQRLLQPLLRDRFEAAVALGLAMMAFTFAASASLTLGHADVAGRILIRNLASRRRSLVMSLTAAATTLPVATNCTWPVR